MFQYLANCTPYCTVLYCNYILFCHWPNSAINDWKKKNHLHNFFTPFGLNLVTTLMISAHMNILTGEKLKHFTASAAYNWLQLFLCRFNLLLHASKQKCFSIMEYEYCLNISIATQTMCGKMSNIYCKFAFVLLIALLLSRHIGYLKE